MIYMQAFHNNPQLQKEFMSRVQGHYDADEIIHGVYWEKGKGCAIGCMIHSSDHEDLEPLYGIPEWIARLIDTLFEGMENKYSKEFVLDFAKVISKPSFLGFDNWKHIFHPLCAYILKKECKNIDQPSVKQQINDVIALHEIEEPDKEKWTAAARHAWYARYAARYSEYAAGSTRAARTARYSEYAAKSVRSVESAEYVESAARAAARSVESTGHAARPTTYKSIADKFLELLDVKK